VHLDPSELSPSAIQGLQPWQPFLKKCNHLSTATNQMWS